MKKASLPPLPKSKGKASKGSKSVSSAAQDLESAASLVEAKALREAGATAIEKALKSAQAAAVPADERQQVEEYAWMFRRTSKLIRKLEKRMRYAPSTKDIYALCTLISQQREIIADLRVLGDSQHQIAGIQDRVVDVMMKGVGQTTLDVYYQLRRLLMEVAQPKQTQFALKKLEALMRDQVNAFRVSRAEANEAVLAFFSAPPASAVKGKKKRVI